jgi:hypothetical protein
MHFLSHSYSRVQIKWLKYLFKSNKKKKIKNITKLNAFFDVIYFDSSTNNNNIEELAFINSNKYSRSGFSLYNKGLFYDYILCGLWSNHYID